MCISIAFYLCAVENLQRLLAHFAEDRRVREITELTASSGDKWIYLHGLAGAGDCFVLTGLMAQKPGHFLIIEPDKEKAAYSFNTLSSLLPGQKIHFLPDSFKRPLVFEELVTHQILQRTEAVSHISDASGSGSLIVSYPEALFEKIVSPEALQAKKIRLEKGDLIELDDLMHQLIDFGFERVDFVYEPGQFSIRGGIIDLFTYGSDWPYRIELFDIEVESIRTFDPLTQLSQRNIQHLTIIPNMQGKSQRGDLMNIFDILPQNSTIWMRDFQELLDKWQICFEKGAAVTPHTIDQDKTSLVEFFQEKPFLFVRDIINGIEAFPRVIRSNSTHLPVETVHFNQKPQPSFNKNFEFLISDLRDRQRKDFTCFLLTDNAKQVERFYNIFEDLNAEVDFHPITKAIHEGFIDEDVRVLCYTDHQIFNRFHRYTLRKGFTKEQAISLKMLRELVPGDYVTHIDHGIGRYSGLEKINISGHIQESVRLIYKNNDILYVSIHSLHKISKFVGKDGTTPSLSKLGSDTWENLKRSTKRKVKDIANQLIKLYAARRAAEGFAFPPDGYLQNELEASFIYEDTPDQLKATQDVKEDMMKSYPMDRLICGDVGFGKTEVAIRGAFKAVVGGKQVAVLVPTTILALQHYHTFSERLKEFGVEVSYVNRFRSARERKEIFKTLKEGKIDIIIGTHALLNKMVEFKDLGLLIVDEEQKFGVSAKEKLRSMRVQVDTMTLTATPIPRTLQFSLMGARDLSIIQTPPPNRQPIHTERRIFDDHVIKEAIYYEVNRGGQVFFVHNRVKNLAEITGMIQRLCPDLEIVFAHGQMEAQTLEETLVKFIDKKYDVLVCTNIIETGLDIPNANTIIINNAHQFGLSDLHQLRGRVGRSNKKAFCYLFAPPLSALTQEARKRLQTIEEFSDLGSGLQIAMRDLDIRGAGNLLGAEQSGFIADIGYETYQKILEEAMQELKEQEYKDLFAEDMKKEWDFVRDVILETDVEMLIPDSYVSVIDERLRLYTELDELEAEEDITAFSERMRDRFGPLPDQVFALFEGLRLRWMCKKLGFDRLILKGGTLRCFFLKNVQSPFYESERFKKLLSYLASDSSQLGIQLKQSRSNLILLKGKIESLEQARELLELFHRDAQIAMEETIDLSEHDES